MGAEVYFSPHVSNLLFFFQRYVSHNDQVLAKTNQLLEVETKLRKETETHASDLEKTIESLTAENTKLKKELEEAGDKYKVCFDKMVSVQKYLDTLKDHIKDILNPLIGKHHLFSLFSSLLGFLILTHIILFRRTERCHQEILSREVELLEHHHSAVPVWHC